MKGICFKEPLFLLTVQGIKTQTRRIINNQPDARGFRTTNVLFEDWHGREARPRYKVGETVYLKEPYHIHVMSNPFVFQKWEETVYKYGEDAESIGILEDELGISKWKNKLFMPEKYARHFIKITSVRAERLQDISEEDCIKEGISQGVCSGGAFWGAKLTDGTYTSYSDSPREAYKRLIDKINGPGTWENNPWVWVYDYELTKHY